MSEPGLEPLHCEFRGFVLHPYPWIHLVHPYEFQVFGQGSEVRDGGGVPSGWGQGFRQVPTSLGTPPALEQSAGLPA